MTKKIPDKKKVGEVTSTRKAAEVESAEAVSGVESVKPAAGIAGVGKAGAVGRRGPTRIMSVAEREELLRMIDQEADKLFGGSVPPARREQVVKAVKMAVDSALVEDEEEKK